MRNGGKGTERIGERGAGDAAFGEDGGDVARGGDVECGMGGVYVGGDANALEMSDFGGGTLFDGDVLAIGDGKIKSGNRGGDVKGDVVFPGEDGDLVGADLVGGVAVSGDAVRAGDDRADFYGLQEVSNHIIGDKREGDAAFVQFPGGEARALEVGPSFGDEDVEFFALFKGNTDDAEGGADAASGERASVALGHDVAFAGHEFSAEPADGFVDGLFFEMNQLGFLHHSLLDLAKV